MTKIRKQAADNLTLQMKDKPPILTMVTAPCNPVRLRTTDIVVKNTTYSFEQVKYQSLTHHEYYDNIFLFLKLVM